MKDSQQMSVDISSQDDMALKALAPVSLKEANIFRVDSIVTDNLDNENNYNLNLSDVEDDERGERKENSVSDSAVPEISQESEDDILNKFDSPENEQSPVTNGCQETDENLEERLLSDLSDGKEEKEEAITTNGESVNNADVSELNKKSDDIVISDTHGDKNCVADEEGRREKEDVVENEKEIEDGEENEKEIEDGEKKDKQMEDVEKEKVEQVEEMENSEEIEKEKDDAEEKEKDAEKKEKDDAEKKVKDDADKKEKANAELLKDQIMDTEDLLQIVDQQDTGGTNESSCSGENTPDKEESDEAETECNDTETDKNEDEDDTQTSKNDDDTVDIEEDSPYKEEFDSELDKEYAKIVNEKENESLAEESNDKSEKMEEDVGENAQEDKSVTDSEKDNFQDSELDMEVSQNEKIEGTDNIETEASDKQTSSDSSSKTKRTLSEPDITTVEAKRLRLEEDDDKSEDSPRDLQVSKDDEESKPSAPIIALNAISEYMQKRTLKKFTREDLEQICLMKMCEAICHKSEIGELRHQLSVQEQMIDMWRKEAAQLTKQARDLEIVNKRLLHEVRLKNDKDKPLIPVKITRSVGLQVRSDNNVMCNVMTQKRRFVRPQQVATTTTPPTPQKNRFNLSKPAQSPTNKTPTNKSVPPSPLTKSPLPIKPKPVTPKTPNSLLSKALQNSTVQAANSSSTATATATGNTVTPPLASISNTPTTPTTPITTKSLLNASPKPIKPTESKGVIDLTDEDEKKPSPASTNASTTVNNTTQGVRIVSAPVKSTSTVSSAGVVNPPRIMYLYNNQLHQGVLATDSSKVGSQKVMFKLNSNVIGQANGVLTAVTNGSPIAVSNGAVRTNQVQSVRFSSPVTTVRTSPSSKAVAKHPAPLPPPPITQINLAARKPIPPKPHLSIRRSSGGIVLSWKMPYILDNYEAIASYQLYAYQETTSPPSSDMWRKVGDVKALALPMACTLTQFADGNKYHFAVRAVDVQKRMGPFSDPEQILL